jgi:hypothetical protein
MFFIDSKGGFNCSPPRERIKLAHDELDIGWQVMMHRNLDAYVQVTTEVGRGVPMT